MEQDRYSSAAQTPGGWSCRRGFVLTNRHDETADAVSLTLRPPTTAPSCRSARTNPSQCASTSLAKTSSSPASTRRRPPTGVFRLPDSDVPLVFITADIGVRSRHASLRGRAPLRHLHARLPRREFRHRRAEALTDSQPIRFERAGRSTRNGPPLLSCGCIRVSPIGRV